MRTGQCAGEDGQSSEEDAGTAAVPLAVIGLSFEFPGDATSEPGFWEMIHQGKCASSEFPADRLNIDAFYHPDRERPSTFPVRGGHFLKSDIAAFDAPFFSITPNEAACMDPQHRKMLETAYHALEDAGIPLHSCVGSNTSCYTGCFTNDYQSILQQDYDAEQRQAAVGLVPSMLANRLSWFFDFKGASMNLDTACSSSLVALHLACQDLRAGNSSMALVGGANLIFHPNFMKFLSDFNFLSSDSRCHSFDQQANGYARGDGLSVMVVKRLDDALRDGNTIRAVIRNTGSNQDGRTPVITQPSADAQISLIERTYQRAKISMEPTRFFEAHATGTAIGDPIEGSAIGKAFSRYRSPEDPLYIGAVKANIGHLEGGSGLAGVIKSILVLENGLIPPIAGLQNLNKSIDAQRLCLHFPTRPIPWPDVPVRRACVNSFGFGGSNAVVVLDDAYSFLKRRGLQGHHRTLYLPQHHDNVAPTDGSEEPTLHKEDEGGSANDSTSADEIALVAESNMAGTACGSRPVENGVQNHDTPNGDTCGRKPKSTQSLSIAGPPNLQRLETRTPRLLVWSASDEQAAHRMNDLYKRYLADVDPASNWEGLTYGLISNRTQFSWRSFVTVSATGQDTQIVASVPTKARTDPRIAFVFTGQGAQYLGMGRQLTSFPIFLDSIRKSGKALEQIGCQWSPLDILCGDTNGHDIEINAPEFSQPLTTILQMGLVDLLESLGVQPFIVLGHSSGEVAAAYATGALTRESAVAVAYHRGVLSSKIAANAGLGMMAVGISKDQATTYISSLKEQKGCADVFIACVNSPNSVTLSGLVGQLAILEGLFVENGIFARRLHVPIAYHSPFMNQISSEYRQSLPELKSRTDSNLVPMISSVTKGYITVAELTTAAYWVRNLTSPVEFEAALSTFLKDTSRKPRRQLKRQNVVEISKVTHLLEIGPHSALQGPIRQNLHVQGDPKPQYLPSLVRGRDASISLMELIGTLYCAGFSVDLLRTNGLDLLPGPPPTPSDLPRYPFNHSQKYWKESKMSRNFRFREAPRHELLGTRALDWNPTMAVWRNSMRLAELPWLEDHKIGVSIVLPGAASLVMAMEAQLQVIDQPKVCLGVHVRDAAFSHAVTFPPGLDTVETQLTLSKISLESDAQNWSQFRLFLLENGTYVECARGLIRAVFDETDLSHVLDVGPWKHKLAPEKWAAQIRKSSVKPVSSPYGVFERTEHHYGPSFQGVSSLQHGTQGDFHAEVDCQKWRAKGGGCNEVRFSGIHPATLDSVVQPTLQTLYAQRGGDRPTMMPVHVSETWISCSSDLYSSSVLDVTGKYSQEGFKGLSVDIAVSMDDPTRPVVYMEGLRTAFIASTDTVDTNILEKPRRLCTKLSWKPDIDLMCAQELLAYCTASRPAEAPNGVEIYREQQVAILCYIEEALDFVDRNPERALQPHLRTYVEWMRYQRRKFGGTDHNIANIRASVRRLLSHPELRQKHDLDVENAPGDGFFFMKICRNLLSVLRGEIDPLDLIFRDGLADRFYKIFLDSDHHAFPTSRFVDLLSFKNPSLKILEVGAGTGGTTMRLLETMSGAVTKWAQYDYTDVSPSFFSKAREKFEQYDNLRFMVCDISKDTAEQGFEAHAYDLVVASHVLHATNCLKDSLQNIRRLLKPGGRLLLLETTRPDVLQTGFAFGLLKGWWSPLDHESQVRAPHSPCITSRQWDSLLRENGFKGIEAEFPGQESLHIRTTSIIVSSAAEIEVGPPSRVFLVHDPHNEGQRRAASNVEAILQGFGDTASRLCTIVELESLEVASCDLIIFLVEIDAAFLDSISESDYRRLQSAMVRADSVIWVARADLRDPNHPRQHLALGLGRAWMSEDTVRKFIHLSLEKSTRLKYGDDAALITKLAQRIVKMPVEAIESNYSVVDGELQICRVCDNGGLDTIIEETLRPCRTQPARIGEGSHFALEMSPGQLDSLTWVETDDCSHTNLNGANKSDAQDTLQEDEVCIFVRAIGLTYRDRLVANAQLDAVNLGTECAGVVAQAGAQSGFQPGDRVCLVSTSTCRSVVRVSAGAVCKIPTAMTFAEAASLPVSQWIAYHALVNSARLQSGDTVLVLHGASCVGQMLIQLAIKRGARVLVLVNSTSKAKFLRDDLHIPDADIFQTGDRSLSRKIETATKGRGVDIVVGAIYDTATSGSLADISPCLGPCGKLVDTSLYAVPRSTFDLSSRTLATNMSSTSINLIDLLHGAPIVAHRIFRDAMRDAFHDNDLVLPQPRHEFAAFDSRSAFAHLQDPDQLGKRVIVLDPDTVVSVNTKNRSSHRLPHKATYVLGGGLGGLGRSISRWLVRHGARHLILLSRSGAQTETAKDFVRGLQAQGVQVETPQVDMGDIAQLAIALRRLDGLMPPIRGCIQCSMVLRDNLFANMAYDDWKSCIDAKATASWNLHALLPKGLDFFIMLASINGIFGGRAQANYAAANTFQDALAHHRTRLGEKAVSIDLGMMVGEGLVAQDTALLNNLRRFGQFMDLHEEELLALLEQYCDASSPVLPRAETQIMMGIETASAIRAKGVDFHHSLFRPMFRQLFRMDATSASKINVGALIDYASELRHATSDEVAAQLITDWFKAKIAQIVGVHEIDVDTEKPVHTHGIDSLVAIDLKNWFSREIKAEIPVFVLLGNKPLVDIAREAAESSQFRLSQ